MITEKRLACENDMCVKFRVQTRVLLSSRSGKQTYITVQPYEFIDIDLKTGKFFVKNKFTGSKMKLIDPNSDIHIMDANRIPVFVEMAKRSEGALVWNK